MKTILIAGLLFLSGSAMSQVSESITMGTETFTCSGNLIYNDGDEEKAYYKVEDGVFHYYYSNKYNGAYQKYMHHSCPAKDINLKKADFRTNDDGTGMLHLTTKKLVRTVNELEVSNSDEGALDKQTDESFSLSILYDSKETADAITNAIKKR